jgi:uncharacterized membrane protein
MSATAPPPPQAVPAGWYPDPEGRGQRYWDGNNWTDNIAPATNAKSAGAGDWVGGVLLAILIPIVGLIAGAVYMSKADGRRQVGIWTVVISLVVMGFWLLVMSRAGGSASGY